MDKKSEIAPEIPGRTDSDESTVRCLAAKNVVEQFFINMTFAEANPKIKEIETVLESMQKNGISTVEAALESIRLAGAMNAYLCKDGIYAARKAAGLNRADG